VRERLKQLSCIILLAGLMYAPTAQAAQQCDAPVVDQTSQRVLGDQGDVLAVTRRLENLGADVRVRAFQSAPDGGLDGYYSSQIAACPSWRGLDGRPKANLVVFMFSMDHKSAIMYGSNWHPAFDGNVDRIRSDYMNTQFRLGKFSQGIVNSEAEAYRAMNDQLHPKPSSKGSGKSAGDSVAGKIIAWTVAGFVAIILLVFAGVGISRMRERRRRNEAERKKAKRGAETAAQEALTAIDALSSSDDTERNVQIISINLNEEDKQAVQAMWDRANEQVNAVYSLNGKLVDNPQQFSLERLRTTEDYEVISKQYSELWHIATEAATALDQVEALCSRLQKEMDQAPATLEHLKAEFAEVQKLKAEVAEEGYRIPQHDGFSRTAQHIVAAEQLVADKKFGLAIGELESADEACESAKQHLNGLRATRTGLQARHSELTARATTAEEQAHEAEATLATMSSIYNLACWQDLGTSDAVKAKLAFARESLDAANVCISMERQSWQHGSELLDRSEQRITECVHSCTDVMERSKELGQFAASTDEVVAELRQDLREAEVTIGSLKGAQGHHLGHLRKVEAEISQLEESLRQDKPNYIEGQSMVNAIQGAMSSALTNAQREDERIREEERQEEERRRREEEAARRRREEAERSRNTYAVGIGDFGGSSSSGGGIGDFGGGSSGGWGGDSGGGSSGGW
jgi:uncharacterized membrane protein YgcG